MAAILAFVDDGCLGSDDHTQEKAFFEDNIGASLFVSAPLGWGETFRRANIFKVTR